jgi:uncharacterized protein YndB with AHSA1/START domain
MGQVRMHGHVEAPIDRVFDFGVDRNRWAEWEVEIVEMTPGAPLAKVGDRFTGKTKVLGRVYEATGEVTAIERPRMFAFTSTSAMGGHQNWTTHFSPAGGGTDFDCDIDYEIPLGIVGAVVDKLFFERQVQRMVDQSRDNFIALVEHEALQPV